MFDVNNYLSFAVHGASGKHGGGVAGSVEQLLAFLETLTEKSAADIFATLMPGFSAMENIHPLFVHFPIAFFTAFVLIDIVASVLGKQNWRQVAGVFLYFGTVMAAVTVAAGLEAAEAVAHGEDVHMIMERHKQLGISILSLGIILSIWRLLSRGVIKGGANVFYLIIAILLSVLIVFAADLGGLMVYKYGVAVETSSSSTSDYHLEHTHSH